MAVLTEVMAVTHGVETAMTVLALHGGQPAGASVAVLGVGPLGLCHLVKARMMGAGAVIAADVLPGRLAVAQEFGADLVLDSSRTEAAERAAAVRALTGGLGADVVIDCTGVPETFTESLGLVRTGGVVIEAGTFVDMGPVAVNPNSAICTRNVTILGVGGERSTAYQPSMRLMAANLDRYPLDRILTHTFALEDAARALAVAQSGEAMQVAMDPALPPGSGGGEPEGEDHE